MAAGVRPAVGFAPQAKQDRELVFKQVRTVSDGRKRNPELAMLQLIPAGSQPHLEPPAAHLVDGRRHLGQVAGMAKGDRREQGPKADPIRIAGQAGQHGPRIGGRQAGRSREARVVVRAKEGLEPVRFGAFGDGNLFAVAQPLLGLDLKGKSHVDASHAFCC